MMDWLRQVLSDFSGLLENHAAIMLFALIILIVIALVWIWLKVPSTKVESEESSRLAEIWAWIKASLSAFFNWASQIVRHMSIAASDVYDTPLYLQLKPASKNSLFDNTPAGQTPRSVPKHLQGILSHSAQDYWYLLKDMTVAELSIEVPEDPAAEPPDKKAGPPPGLKSTLDKISHQRPQRPIDGILISVPAAMLEQENAERLDSFIATAVHGLATVDADIPFALPVYLIVSHCESLTGFNAFAQQNWDQHQQIFGWSSDVAFGEKYQPKVIRRGMRYIHADITRNQVERTAQKNELILADQFVLLGLEINAIEDAIKATCDRLFDNANYKNGMHFRGLYFVGRSLEEEQLERSADSIFLYDLLEKKIAAEANLAVPVGRGMLRHKQLFDRYKQVSLAIVALLFVFGGWSLWSLKNQYVSVTDSLTNMQSTLQTGGTGYAQVYNVLDQLSNIDARRFFRWGLPASWFASVDDDLVQVISENHFDLIVFPAMECTLGSQFGTLMRTPTQYAAKDNPASFQRVFAQAWLNELEQFQDKRHSFIELSKPSKQQGAQILTQFSDLIYALYGIKPEQGFFRRSNLYALAMEKLDYRYQAVNNHCPKGSTGVDKSSSPMFWDHVEMNANEFYSRIQSSSRIPTASASSIIGNAEPVSIKPYNAEQVNNENVIAVDRWFGYIAENWLGENANTNPCREMRRRLAEIQVAWDDPTRESGQAADQSVALFSEQFCEKSFYRQLENTSYGPVAKPFVRDAAGKVQFSPAMLAFRGDYGSVQNLAFMSLDTSKQPAPTPGTIVWDASRIITALNYYREYEQYARDNGFPAPDQLSPDTADADAYALQSSMLTQLRNAMIYQLELSQFGQLASANTATNAQAGPEQLVLDRVRNFSSVVEGFYQLRDSLNQLGFHADSEAWVDTTRSSALSLLTAVDQLARSSRLYLSETNIDTTEVKVLKALYGIDDKKALANYLSSQLERASFLANNYAEAPVTYLLNTGGQSSAQSAREQIWQQTLAELAKVARKDPENTIAKLEQRFSDSLDVTLPDCPSEYQIESGQDIFTQADGYLSLAITMFCDRVKVTDAVDEYDELAKEFNTNLAGRYPFIDPAATTAQLAVEASPAAVRNFFNKFDAISDSLEQEFSEKVAQAGDQVSSYSAPLAFVKELQAVSRFLALTLNQTRNNPGGVNLQLTFRIYKDHENMGLNQIVYQALEASGRSVTLPGSSNKLTWEYGEPLQFSARLASSSNFSLTQQTSSTVNVQGSTISYTESGSWALFRMLQRYQVVPGNQETIAQPGTVILKFPVKAQYPKTGVSTTLTRPPLVPSSFSIPLGVDLYGLNPETKQLELLSLPDSFPYSAQPLRGQ